MRAKFPEQIKICVSADHIKYGRRADCQICPIALAIQSYFSHDHIKDIRVFFAMAHIELTVNKQTIVQVYRLSRAASRFIKNFDNKLEGKPFNFIMKKVDF